MNLVEVVVLPEDDNNELAVQVRQAREQLAEKSRAQAELLQKLELDLKELRKEHERLELEAGRHFEVLEKFRLPSPPVPLEAVLAAVRSLLTATLPKQVLSKLTEEANRMGVRAAAFEIRGKTAWAASAHGFEPQLTEKALRSLVVPLTVDTPFREVFENGQHFVGDSEGLKKNANVLNRLKPNSWDSILLLPVHSAGAVSAIFYADSGGSEAALPEDALELLAEVAGARIEHLVAQSARAKPTVRKDAGGEARAEFTPGQESPVAAGEPLVEVAERSEAAASGGEASAPSHEEPPPPPVVEAAAPVEPPPTEAPAELPAAGATAESAPAPEPVSVPVAEVQAVVGVAPPAVPGAGFDVSQLSEAEQKVHKDARRLAKLLVFEIELYNKTQTAEGRKSKDLYNRLKRDIERSREAFEQRFGETMGKQFDYFHDELVRTLAGNDPSLLGSDYPGPSV